MTAAPSVANNDTTMKQPSHSDEEHASRNRRRRRFLRSGPLSSNSSVCSLLCIFLLCRLISMSSNNNNNINNLSNSGSGNTSSSNNGMISWFASAEDVYYENNGYDDAYFNNGGGDDANAVAAENGDGQDDTVFQFEGNLDFDEVSIMPVSCVNYHNGHMIKFQFYEKSTSLNCHFKNLGTFVVSIAHFMRAYFNRQALMHGTDFTLPGDVGFLNCVMLKETANSNIKLYAKIGCQHRDTYTSTKLELIVYKDAQCSKVYENTDEDKKSNGYDINGYFLSSKVSFRPPFYSCQNCLPDEISDKFSKRYTAWYDDDYISLQGKRQSFNDDANANYAAQADDAVNATDGSGSYYQANDDIYGGGDDANAGDDDAVAADDANYNHYVNTDDEVYYNYKAHDDDFYAMGDDARRGLRRNLVELDASHSITAKESLKDYAIDFHQEMTRIHRQLDGAENGTNNSGYNSMYSVGTWNMCERAHHYGMWCDEDCMSLDTFRVDEWSRSDVFLLVIMCVFMGAMMLLVFAKRVKAYERAAMWGDEPGAPNPGLPPMAMLMLFAIVFTVIVVLAVLKFVNETLVFAVVTCILLFLYMLKLTLFESRKPQFLPARSTRNHSLKEPFY